MLLLIGFPLTAIIAWAFEITPNGIRRTPDLDASAALSPRGGWIEGLLLLGILLWLGFR